MEDRKQMSARTMSLVIVLLLMGSLPVWGQATASLRGTVTDPNGAVVAQAQVTLTNQATGAVRSTATSQDGVYVFPQLSPGTYRLEVAAQGFKTAVRDSLAIQVGLTSTLDVQLEVGSITEEVSVEVAPPAINTTDATMGNPFSELQVRQLPLEARNPAQLLSLQAGVVWAGEGLGDARQGSVFGGRSNQGNVTLDGVDVNNQETQAAMQSVLPIPLDSVQEFRVTTFASGADQGRSSGAQIQLITKSGSNTWHGSAYYFHRNEIFSSKDFFTNRVGNPKAPLKRHIFGVSAGGPMVKDRAFFFLNWESRRDATATPATRQVPSASLRDGVIIYQCANPGECPGGSVVGLSGASHSVPAGFRGLSPGEVSNIIDPCGSTPCTDVLGNSITPGPNSAVLALFNNYPTPNDPSVGRDNGLNFSGFRFNPPIRVDNNDYVARFDFNLDPQRRHTVYWRGTLADDKQDQVPQQFPIDPVTGQPGEAGALQFTNSKGMAIAYTGQFGTNVVNTFRYGFTRQGFRQTGATAPAVSFRNFSTPQNFNRAFERQIPTHNITNDTTWIMKNHTVQFGLNYRRINNNLATFGNSFPTYSTNAFWMAGSAQICVRPGAPQPTCPNLDGLKSLPPIASGFVSTYVLALTNLLGVIPQISNTFQFDIQGNTLPIGAPRKRLYRNNELELYVQDSYRLKPNFTLTLGVRWSYQQPPWEVNGAQVTPDLNLFQWWNTIVAGADKGVPSNQAPLLSFVPAGKANDGRPFYKPDKDNFAPRVSLAYSPGFDSGPGKFLFGGPGKSSIRAGFTIAYDRVTGSLPVLVDSRGSVGLSTNLLTTQGLLNYFGQFTAPRFSGFSNLPPPGPPFFPLPTGSFPAQPAGAANSSDVVDPNLHTPYSMEFDLTFQRELPKGLTLEIGYIGRQGRGLIVQPDLAQWLFIHRDPVSGQTLGEALQALEAQMNTVTESFNGPCAVSPATCPPIPYFENVFSNLVPVTDRIGPLIGIPAGVATTPTQAMALWVLNRRTNWAGMIVLLDKTIPDLFGLSPYGANFDPTSIGHVLTRQQYVILRAWTNGGNSFYNGLVVSVRRRLGSFQFDANYTLSKSIDDASTLEASSALVIPNAFNYQAGRGFSDFDLRHNFNANWYFELPVGRDKRFGSAIPGWADAILGGWQLTGVWRWRSGFPLTVFNGLGAWVTNWNISGAATQIAPVNSVINRDAKGGPNIFRNPVDTSASNPHLASGTAFGSFQLTGPAGVGSRGTLRSGRFFTIDLGIGKSFHMPYAEGHRLQFRWEIFNLTNTTSFSSGVSLSVKNPGTFGQIAGTASSASQTFPLVPHNRVMQVGLRYEW